MNLNLFICGKTKIFKIFKIFKIKIDRSMATFHFFEPPDVVTSSVPEISGGSFLMNLI